MKEIKDTESIPWSKVKDYINPTIRLQFLRDVDSKNIDENNVNMSRFNDAESNISSELRIYIPCFNRNSRGLFRIWASLFNFAFIGMANEKNENGFSQITTNYNKAMEFLQSDEAKNYCYRNNNNDFVASDFMKFGNTKRVKF